MDLRKEYEKLYENWLSEFQNNDLTAITQKDFNKIKKTLDYINDYHEEEMDDIKTEILKSYKDNINYLFEDLLKIREIKITNSALALKEINLNNVFEAEKLLYENLVRSIKGYKKVKAISLYDEDVIQQEDLSKPEEEPEIDEVPVSKEQKPAKVLDTIKMKDREKTKYTLVRFLKKTPPLVGVDLLNYGPFEVEDMANIPQKNAKILIIEKFAEKIEID